MLTVYTGANRSLSDALTGRVGIALAEDDRTLNVIVPKQLTLLTERLLLDALHLRGSFRIRVLSPARLCTRVFEEAGFPEGVHVDERGRVMLMRRAIRETENLSVYKNAARRRGFAEKCARQTETLLQGGVLPDALRDCAEACSGTSSMKLRDLAAIMENYLSLIAGRFQDGENELIEAANRLERAEFVRESRFFFYGFDVMPPTLTRLIAGVAAKAPSEIFLALANDPNARDADVYLPMARQLGRLTDDCRKTGAQVRRETLARSTAGRAIGVLGRELYAYPTEKKADKPAGVRLVCAKDVREECRIVAAAARMLAMRGMRWGDMQILCADSEAYRQPLIDAFAEYEVPLFLESSRPVSRMAAAECLLTALRLLDKNFRSEDVFALMRTDCTDLTRDEADRLTNYAIRRGVDGSRWTRPLTRGGEAEIEALEPVRGKLIGPVIALKTRLKAAKNLREQLAAAFAYLEDVNAYEKSADLQRQFEARGMREASGALAQAWNRIIGALDQMAELMGEEKLSLKELTQTLSESLDAAIVKPLPQSGDAVYAQSMGRMLMQPAKALFVTGLSDRAGVRDDDLLTPSQKCAVAERTRAYLGPDAEDAARLNRYYLKEALGMASEALLLTCALSGADGSPQKPGLEIALAREIYPELKPMADSDVQELLACAPNAASACAARVISARNAGETADTRDLAAAAALRAVSNRLPDARARLQRIEGLLRENADRGTLKPESARRLYGKLQAQSITRLESFARCPFAYFAKYGLKAEKIEPFELTRRDEGVFLHAAINEFLRAYGRGMNEMDGGDAEEKMGRIADELLSAQISGTPMEDSAAAYAQGRALRATACRCARVLTEQMRGSEFRTDALEQSFGREDGAASLRAGDTVLEGRIDRVDVWKAGESLRVIDFKRGGKSLDLAGAYYGLELQLPVYLGAAQRLKNARSAGVYYFALDEGILNTQTTEPAAVEKERAKQFRMSGLLPEDRTLIDAQTPEPENVFKGRFNKDGSLGADTARASDADFERIVRHAQRTAQRQIEAIRGGDARVRPTNYNQRMACTYCDYRAACLFDAKADARHVRRLSPMKWTEVLEKIALEDGPKRNGTD